MVAPPDLMYLPEISEVAQSKFFGQRLVAIITALSKSMPRPLSLTKVFRDGILLSGVRYTCWSTRESSLELSFRMYRYFLVSGSIRNQYLAISSLPGWT